MSGGDGFVAAAVDMIKRRCIHHVTSDVSLYSNDEPSISEMIHNIEQQLCFDYCQPHGQCQHGRFVS